MKHQNGRQFRVAGFPAKKATPAAILPIIWTGLRAYVIRSSERRNRLVFVNDHALIRG
jgi:hypothetical protein